MLKPWSGAERVWRHKSHYANCQTLTDAARTYGVAWIRYCSARTTDGICGAVLKIRALSLARTFAQQTWASKTTSDGAYMQQAGSAQWYSFFAREWV